MSKIEVGPNFGDWKNGWSVGGWDVTEREGAIWVSGEDSGYSPINLAFGVDDALDLVAKLQAGVEAHLAAKPHLPTQAEIRKKLPDGSVIQFEGEQGTWHKLNGAWEFSVYGGDGIRLNDFYSGAKQNILFQPAIND